MPLSIQTETSIEDVKMLLRACDLPTQDLEDPNGKRFYSCRLNGKLQGTIGLECYAPVALLRSLAVAADCRKRGLGRALVAHAEAEALTQGCATLFLLTTDAAAFFETLRYSPIDRLQAPDSIRQTAQFTSLCPGSSRLLMRRLLDSRCDWASGDAPLA